MSPRVPSVPSGCHIQTDLLSLLSPSSVNQTDPTRRGPGVLHPPGGLPRAGPPLGVLRHRGQTHTGRTWGRSPWGALNSPQTGRGRGAGIGLVPQFPHPGRGGVQFPPAATRGKHLPAVSPPRCARQMCDPPLGSARCATPPDVRPPQRCRHHPQVGPSGVGHLCNSTRCATPQM